MDASVAIKLVLSGESLRAQARQLYHDAALADAIIIAPPIFKVEIDSIICARAYSGRLTVVEAHRLFAGIDRLEIETANPPGMRRRAREIAIRFGQERAYDASYAALAQIRGCEFWTADRVFWEAVHGELPFVRYLAEYPLP